MQFPYGETEINHLTQRDPRLGAAIERIGPIERGGNPDLFVSVVQSIIGQQISSAAQRTLCDRLDALVGTVDAATLHALDAATLQQLGMSHRKAGYIKQFAEQVHTGAFDLDALRGMQDDDVIAALSSLPGIGPWTAEMLLLFSMHRPNVLSFGDLAIQRGMRMLYHHRRIDRGLFEKYRRRYAPYGSTASLYLWAIAGGAIPEMRDWAPKAAGKKGKSN